MKSLRCLLSMILIASIVSIAPVSARMIARHNQVFFSADKRYQLATTVDPSEPPEPCKGVLSRLDANGQYAPIWSVTFQSSFGPSKAFVSDDGYVVALNDGRNSLDNWVQIYSSRGSTIKRLDLADLLRETNSPPYVERNDGPKISDGGNHYRPWMNDVRLDDSSDRVSFVFGISRKPASEITESRDWRNRYWNCKQVTIDLRSGKVGSNLWGE
jgi:hypothetical protein